jgi:hypothetical protein
MMTRLDDPNSPNPSRAVIRLPVIIFKLKTPRFPVLPSMEEGKGSFIQNAPNLRAGGMFPIGFIGRIVKHRPGR